VWMAEK